MGKLKNRKAAGKNEITEEMIKGGDWVMDWMQYVIRPLGASLYLKTGDLL